MVATIPLLFSNINKRGKLLAGSVTLSKRVTYYGPWSCCSYCNLTTTRRKPKGSYYTQLKTRWTAQCPGNFQRYRGYKAATLFHFISLPFPGIWYAIQHYNRQIRKSMYKRTCSDNNEIIRAVSKILSGRNYKHISYINFSNASTRNFRI